MSEPQAGLTYARLPGSPSARRSHHPAGPDGQILMSGVMPKGFDGLSLEAREGGCSLAL